MNRRYWVAVAVTVVFASWNRAGASGSVAETSSGLPASGIDLGAAGPYAIGHTSFMLLDPSREQGSTFGGRRVYASVVYPVDTASVAPDAAAAVFPLDPFFGVWPDSVSTEWEELGYPATYEEAPASRDGPFPLVLFSTGFGGRYTLYLFLAERLASHGYVVAILEPSGDGTVPWEPRPAIGTAAWNRPRDVTLVLDALLSRTRGDGDLLAGVIDPDLVVASGHSLGGYAALALAGGDDSVCDTFDPDLVSTCGPIAPDPRVKAVLALDAASLKLRWSELARIGVPSISLNQEFAFHAVEVPVEPPAYFARQHAAISAHPNYRIDVATAHHWSFTNNCSARELLFRKGLISPSQIASTRRQPWCSTDTPQLEVARLSAQFLIAFLRTHVEGKPGFHRILTPGWALTVESKVELFVTEPDGNPHEADCSDCFRYFTHQPGSDTAVASRDDPFAAAASLLPPED